MTSVRWFPPAALLCAALLLGTNAAPVGGDAIFAVGDGGFLEPVAVHRAGGFMNPGSGDGGPSQTLRTATTDLLAAAGKRAHLIFGGRVVATVPAVVEHGDAHVALPASLRLVGHVSALASPTLAGYARTARRAPTAVERAGGLASAAVRLGTTPARLSVRNLTAIDLGRGTAIVGTVDRRGTGVPRVDKRLFFILERSRGSAITTLANAMTITVTEPLLEEPAEYLVDALAIEPGKPALVTSIIGYDANTFAIYTRKPDGAWAKIYTGGGAAL